MSKQRKKISAWERYLTKEIGIEFKACLYFFAILFFYCMYQVICGVYEANILHMAEMIFMTYAMGYLQVYLLSDFDEGERLGGREICYLFFCSLLYSAVSYLVGWFDRNLRVCVVFFFYIAFMYVCAFLVYKAKRSIDEKLLNDDLRTFQERRKNGESN